MTNELKTITIFEEKGILIKEESEKLEITKADDLSIARDLFKQCQEIEKEVETERTNLVKPHNDVVKQINNRAKEVLIPTQEAKAIINHRVLQYNQEQERIRAEEAEKERKRLEAIRLEEERKEQERKAEEERIRKAEEERLEKIRQEQEAERKKLETEKNEAKRKEMEIEQKRRDEEAKLEAERIRIEQEKRKIEEDKKQLEAEKARIAEEEKEKERQRFAEIEALKNKPKGLTSYWKFEIIDENSVPRNFCSPDSKKINEAIKIGAREIPGLKIYEDKKMK